MELERLRAQTEEEKEERDRVLAQAAEEKKEKERLQAQAEVDQQEMERLRTESTAAKDKQAEAINKAEAERLRLENENEQLKQEKQALEQEKENAEKACKEKDDLLNKVISQIEAKEKEILLKTAELRSFPGTSGQQQTSGEKEPEVEVKLEVDEEGFDPETRAAIFDPDTLAAIAKFADRDVEDDLRSEDFEALSESIFRPTQVEIDAMKDNHYWFERPTSYSGSKRCQPTEQEMAKILPVVPAFIGRMIMNIMPETVITGQPQMVLWYNERTLLPNWVIIWFIRALKNVNARSSDQTLFNKALTLIDAWRERNLYGGNVDDESDKEQ